MHTQKVSCASFGGAFVAPSSRAHSAAKQHLVQSGGTNSKGSVLHE